MKFILFVLCAHVSYTHAKVYKRCELTKEIHEQHHIPKTEAGMFACIAEAHSRLDTSALVGAATPAQGTQYHGLFQFSDEFWCSLNGEKKFCGATCASLRDDDITDDVYCAWYHVFVEHERLSGDGFDAWDANEYCRKQLHKFMRCFDETLDIGLGGVRVNGSNGQNFERNQITEGKSTTSRSTSRTTSRVKATTQNKIRKQDKGKIYTRCELAKELYEKYDVEWEQLPTFVCIASQESGFSTSDIKVSNFDGSTSYGIFQISDKRWCSNGSPGRGCNLECDSLRDKILDDDVACMKRIFEVGQFLSQDWTSYAQCKEGNIWPYVEDCFTYDQSTETPVTQRVRTTTKATVTKQKILKTSLTKKIPSTRPTRFSTKTTPVIQNQQLALPPQLSTRNDIIEPSLILLPPEEDTPEITETTRTTTTRPTTRPTQRRTTTTRRPQFPFLNFIQQQFIPVTQRPSVIFNPAPVPDLTLSLLEPEVSYTDITNSDSSSLIFDTISAPRAAWSYDYTNDELPSVTVRPFSVEYVKQLTVPPRFNQFQF